MAAERVWDAIIVGGGPAGSTVARSLAQFGHDVLLLERDQEVGRKACGGGLTARAARLLDLPLDEVAEDCCPAVRVTVGRRCGAYTGQRAIVTTVHRPTFDNWLLEAARAAGAVVRLGEAARRALRQGDVWQVETACETHRARFLIGADGVRSRVGRALGLAVPTSEQVIAVAQDLQADEETARRLAGTVILDFSHQHGGFAWVFPKGRTLSVGLGIPRPKAPRIAQMLRRYLQREGLDQLPALGPLRGAFIPRGTPLPAYQREGALLAGEAAGLADPLTGEGLCPALHTGQLAAQAVNAALTGEAQAFEAYEKAVRTELLPELRAARQVADLFFGLWGRPWRGLLTSERALRALTALLAGQRSYEDLLPAVRRRMTYGVWGRRR